MIFERRETSIVLSFLLIFTSVLATRLPFLFHGPGLDPDAWRIVIASRRLAMEGVYEVSRFPGNPAVELAMSPLAHAPIWTYGLLTAIISAVAAGVLFLLLQGRTPAAGPKAVLIFLLPAIVIESVTAMDYVWSLCFGLAALYLAGRQSLWLAGCALGLAVATRVTGCLFAPVALLLLMEKNKTFPAWLRSATVLGIVSAVTVAAFFALPFQTYGLGFLRFYDVGYPSPMTIFYRATFSLGGVVGSLLAVCLIGIALYHHARNRRTGLTWPSIAALCGAILFGLLFLRAPFESGYLIPCIVFLFYYAALWVPSRIFIAATVGIVLNGLVDFTPPRFGPGPILEIQAKKSEHMELLKSISEQLDQLQPNDILIAGYLESGIIAVAPSRYRSDQVVYQISPDLASRTIESGGRLFYVEKLEKFIEGNSQIVLQDFAAKPI